MTHIIAKGYTILYMCMQVMICQSEWSPEMFLRSQTPSMGDMKTHQMGEGMWRKLFKLLGLLQNPSYSK